ncbi:MAG: 16S rRNA (uracil(1498)-N(3))-methyltransferase [Puniceicoccales bacterium]|nr:16S rRNA (uracil(1498)-N(3))-methyltransferase [Puniceicoccales bacterium]
MATYYVYHPEGFSAGAVCHLLDAEAHHLLRVLRITARDRLFVFDGNGNIGRCSLQSADHRHCTIAVGEITDFPPPVPLILLQGIVKNAAMDQIIHQATELRVTQIFPILCNNSVASANEIHVARRLERWRQIAIEACKQSKNPFLPQIFQPCSIDSALKLQPNSGPKIVAALWGNCQPWGECISSVSRAKSITVAVGPEGDFSQDEYETLAAADFFFLSLGPCILTTQTATVAIISAIQLAGRCDHGTSSRAPQHTSRI